MSEPEQKTFETLMGRLEELVQKLESNELSLEDSIEAYEEAVGVARQSHGRLAAAQRRIEEVTQRGDLVPADPEAVEEPER